MRLKIKLTEEHLELNPELKGFGLNVGDTIQLPVAEIQPGSRTLSARDAEPPADGSGGRPDDRNHP